MKKLLFIFTALLLSSCSSGSDDNNSSSSDFHPPAWIQGDWLLKGATNGTGVLFSFTSNDFCMTNAGVTKQCQQAFVNQMRNPGNTPKVIETVTSTKYTAEIQYYAGQSVIYSFRKLSNTSIEWTSIGGSEFIKQY